MQCWNGYFDLRQNHVASGTVTSSWPRSLLYKSWPGASPANSLDESERIVRTRRVAPGPAFQTSKQMGREPQPSTPRHPEALVVLLLALSGNPAITEQPWSKAAVVLSAIALLLTIGRKGTDRTRHKIRGIYLPLSSWYSSPSSSPLGSSRLHS